MVQDSNKKDPYFYGSLVLLLTYIKISFKYEATSLYTYGSYRFLMAGKERIELSITVLETAVIPLNYFPN